MNKREKYIELGKLLSIEEKENIKKEINKSCNNCANFSCRVEQKDKPILDCIAWENAYLLGEYKTLKLTKKSI